MNGSGMNGQESIAELVIITIVRCAILRVYAFPCRAVRSTFLAGKRTSMTRLCCER